MEMKPDIKSMTINEYLERKMVMMGIFFYMWDITVEDVERIMQFLTPNVLDVMDDVIQPLIPKTIHTTPPDTDYVAPATKSILDDILDEFRNEVLDVTMVDERAESNPTKDLEELKILFANDRQSHYTEIQVHSVIINTEPFIHTQPMSPLYGIFESYKSLTKPYKIYAFGISLSCRYTGDLDPVSSIIRRTVEHGISKSSFVEANYKVLESLLRERRRQIRNEDLRTELEYFNEDYDEEREMELRPEPNREATPTLRTRSWARHESVSRIKTSSRGGSEIWTAGSPGKRSKKERENIRHLVRQMEKGEKDATPIETPVLMIRKEGYNPRKRPSERNNSEVGEITIPPLRNISFADPVIIKAYVSGRQVNRGAELGYPELEKTNTSCRICRQETSKIFLSSPYPGLMLVSREGKEYTYALRFEFETTNNEAEYEALLTVEVIQDKSIMQKEVVNVTQQKEDSWMIPIREYLQFGKLLDDPQKARKLRIKAMRCETYQIHSPIPRKPKQKMTSIMSAWPFSQRGIDIVGPLPIAPGGARFLVVAIDYFTKWAEAKPLTSTTGKHMERFVWEHIVRRFETPQIIISDNRKQSRKARRSNNREIIKGMERMLGKAQRGWVDEIPQVLWAHRTTPKSSNGETPFSLVYGSEVVVPIAISIKTRRIQDFHPRQNEKRRTKDLDILEERSEIASIKEAHYKQNLEGY
nr:reverse transcriptase domain-containing protein [Tanacetum cinerariifolium]